jgi:hypothetical protein
LPRKWIALAFRSRLPQVPQTLMRSDQAFHVPPPRAAWREGPTRQHHFQNVQQLLGDLEISLIARMMEGYQDLVL